MVRLTIRMSPKGDKDKSVNVDLNATVAQLKAQMRSERSTYLSPESIRYPSLLLADLRSQ